MTMNDVEKSIKSIVPNAKILKGINEYHIATNALLINNNSNNHEIIDELMKILYQLPIVEKISIVNRYLNIRFHNKILDIMTLNYNCDSNEVVNIEFCSPNPTGDMHLGHLRSTLYGAALSELYKLCNLHVTTDMYINNAGNQFKLFINSLKGHKQNNIQNIEYKGEYVKEYAHLLNDNFTGIEVVNMMINKFQHTLQKFHIKHDRIILETDQYNSTVEAISILKEKGLIRRGRLTNQIDQSDKLIIQNIDGCNDFVIGHILYNSNTNIEEIIYTYAAYDIGYSYGKFKNGFAKQICCVGEDHLGQIEKMNNIMKYIDKDIELRVLYTGIVKFEIDDQIVKMSKRQGTFITIDSILEKYSRNALIQLVFSHTEHQKLTIDLSNINENIIYTITYVYSQIMQNHNKTFYNDDELIRLVIFWEDCIKHVYYNKSIHLIYAYIYNFAMYLYDNKLYQYNLHEEVKNIFITACRILFIEVDK